MPPGRRHTGFLRLPDCRGFTYIEVLVAILVIGLVTPIFIAGLLGSLTHARRAQDHGAATAWLQGEVDYMRGRCYERLAPATHKVTSVTLRPGEPQLPSGFTAAVVKIDAAAGGLLHVTVSLYRKDWTDATPVDRPAFSTTTYIGDVRVWGSCP
ncbi:MAG: type II secretion system protein [Armatimonadota bacterium]